MKDAIKNGSSDLSEFKPRLQELLKLKDERIANLRREIGAVENNRDCWKFMYVLDESHKYIQIININIIQILFQTYRLKNMLYVRIGCLLLED